MGKSYSMSHVYARQKNRSLGRGFLGCSNVLHLQVCAVLRTSVAHACSAVTGENVACRVGGC